MTEGLANESLEQLGRGKSRMLLALGLGALVFVVVVVLILQGISRNKVVSPSMTANEKNANLWLVSYAGPLRYLDHAAVLIKNDQGVQVGQGITDAAGQAHLHVSGAPSVSHPFVVDISGGNAKGESFNGLLSTKVNALGLDHINHVNLVTSAAMLMDAKRWNFAERESKVLLALGFGSDAPVNALEVYSTKVGDKQLEETVRVSGGYTSFIQDLAHHASHAMRLKGLSAHALETSALYATTSPSPAKLSAVHSVQGYASGPMPVSLLATSSTSETYQNAPCQSAYTAPEAPGDDSISPLQNYGEAAISGVIEWAISGDPAGLATGLVGAAFTSINGGGATEALNAATTANIQGLFNQIACVSAQVQEISNGVSNVALQVATTAATSCETQITGNYGLYQEVISDAAANPGTIAAQFNSSNSSLTQLMTAIQQSIGNGCNGAINQMLFTTGGGQTAGWNQFLSNLEQGTISGCGASDSGFTTLTTLTPGCITLAQSFLNFWGSVEYEQATMVTDYENYLSTVGNQSGVATAQNTYLGTSSSTSCKATPSLANLSANSTVSSFCQDQQNIADVWPQNLYSDELLYISGSIPGLTGFAVSAVPASWGTNPSTVVGPSNILLQSGCGASTSCYFDVGDLFTNQLALSTWNQEVAATPSSSLLQSPNGQPQVAYSAISGLDPGSMDASVATFLTSWLDAEGTEPCASNCAPWVINGSQSNVLYGFCEYLYDGSAQVLWDSNVGWQNCAPTVPLPTGQSPVYDGIVAFLNPLNVVSNVYSIPGWSQLPASPQVSLLMQRDWSQGSPWPVFSATTSN